MAETAIPPPPAPTAHSPLARAEHFVWRTARVLEQRLFAYHFRNAAAVPVETALDAYRNPDGGYGHALEPALRGPASRLPHTVYALRVLDAVEHRYDRRIEHTCRYLASVSASDGALPGALTATGPVVGLLHRSGVWHAWLFRATGFCWLRAESVCGPDPYAVRAAVDFLDAVPDRARAEAAADRLGRLLREHRLAVLDPGAPGEHGMLPHDYARTPRSLARAWFTDDEMARSLDYLSAAQQDDGGWPVDLLAATQEGHAGRPGHWPDHRPDRSPTAVLEARPAATITALRTLRSHGRPVA